MFHVAGQVFDAGFIVSSRDQSFVEIVLSVASIVNVNSVFHLQIPASAGIQLPFSGMASCPPGSQGSGCPISLHTNASAGPVSTFELLQSGGIGQFRDPVTLRFSPRKAGKSTNLALSFVPEMDIAAGEIVQLVLSDSFTGADFGNANVSILVTKESITSTKFVLVTWARTVNIIDVLFQTRLLAGSLTEITIPETLGIRLPLGGVRLVQDGRLLRTEASAGFVVGVAPETQAVGSFMYGSALDFSVLRENDVTNFTVRLTPQMLIARHETVELVLPGFEFVANFHVATDPHDHNTTGNATWSSENWTLVWTLAETISPGSAIVLHIPDAAMLKLPFRGILNGTTNFAVSTKAAFGLVEFEEISSHPLVGSFAGTTKLSFLSRAAEGEAAALQIAFMPVIALLPGETVEIMLPGFRAQNQSRCISNTGYITQATWSNAENKLILTVAEQIAGSSTCNSSTPMQSVGRM